MSSAMACFAVIVMMAIGFGAIAVILGSTGQEVKKLTQRKRQ